MRSAVALLLCCARPVVGVSRADSFRSSSVAAKTVVSGLTSLLNVGAPVSVAPRVRASARVSAAELLAGLRGDFVDREYLWSGKITPELYSEDCTFTDPTLCFTGLATFERNLARLEPVIDFLAPAATRRVSLLEIALDERSSSVVATWRMLGDIALPWGPRLELEGRTTFSYGDDGRVVRYDEEWLDVTASAVLLGLLRPWSGAADAVRMPALTPVVVLPGFGNAAVDYLEPLGQPREVGLVAALERRGAASVDVVPLERVDWINILRGVLDLNFYSNSAQPDGPGYGWYLDRVKATVETAVASAAGEPAMLVAHSAGGWLARALLRRETEAWARQHVRLVVTLGAPHEPPRDLDQCATRGLLAALRDADAARPVTWPPFVTVAGDSVRAVPPGEPPVRGEPPSPTAVAADSYARVLGYDARGLSGDGVVPLAAAHLPYAVRVTLSDVQHSINQAGTTLPNDNWYGSDANVDKWLKAVVETMETQRE